MANPIVKNFYDKVKYPEMLHGTGSIGYMEKAIIGQLLLMISPPQLILEMGIYEGHTTRFIADFLALNKIENCQIVGFDTPEVIASLETLKSYPNIKLVPGCLPFSLDNFVRKTNMPIDFAVIDADHTYGGVTQELELVNLKLRPNGYIFCHDYVEANSEYEGVVYAVDRFANVYDYDILPLNHSNKDGEEITWGSAILRKRGFKKSSLLHLRYWLKYGTNPLLIKTQHIARWLKHRIQFR